MRDERSLEQKLEAMLTVALEPITTEELADVVDEDAELVLETLRTLRQEFVEQRRGFQLAELASGWVMQTAPEVASWVTKFANRDVSHRLSSAALETLAIIAYRQPVSRAQITALRGVNVDGVVRLLEQRGYIEEKGRALDPVCPSSMARPSCSWTGWVWRRSATCRPSRSSCPSRDRPGTRRRALRELARTKRGRLVGRG